MASLRSIPSVRKINFDLWSETSSNRTLYPTMVPRRTPISAATLFEMDTAATLRGCVTAIEPLESSLAS